MKQYKVLLLSFTLAVFAQMSQAAAIKDNDKALVSSIVTGKQSPIEKALAQQKRGENKLISEDDQLKVLTSMKNAPTQNFLADQHQRFSRLIQAIFQPHSS